MTESIRDYADKHHDTAFIDSIVSENLKQVQLFTGKSIEELADDREYRGEKELERIQTFIPAIPQSKNIYYQRKKEHKSFCKRAGIETNHSTFDLRLSIRAQLL